MSGGRPYMKRQVTVSKERLYELVRRPIVTEKSMTLAPPGREENLIVR